MILVGTNDPRLAVGREVGADVTINRNTEDLMERIRESTEGHMVDVVIEAVGKPAVWGDIASILAPRARVGMTGLFAGQKCEVDFDPLVVNNVTVFGCLGGPSLWDECIDLHQRGRVTARPMITHHLPLPEFEKGIEIMRNRTDNAIKVVLEP